MLRHGSACPREPEARLVEALSPAVEIDKRPDHADMVERVGAGGEWLHVLEADEGAVGGVHRDVKTPREGNRSMEARSPSTENGVSSAV
jgi:hypothetical protein